MITLDNYEGYLMRYADGELGNEERREVEAFLAEHPDLAKELEEITAPEFRVTAPLLTMPDKEKMLHTINSASVKTQKKALWQCPATWRIAAAVALLLLAGTVIRNFIPSNESGAITAENKSDHSQSTQLEDIIDINTVQDEKIETAIDFDAVTNKSTNKKQAIIASNEPTNEAIENCITDDTLIIVGTITDALAEAETGTAPAETESKADVSPSRTSGNTDVIVGSVIESNNLTVNESGWFIGRTYNAITKFLGLNSNNKDKVVAFND